MTQPIKLSAAVPSDERVLIAVLPSSPELAGPVRFMGGSVVKYRHPGGGVRVLDMDGGKGKLDTRWWKVVAAARSEGMDVIPVRYDGPAEDVPRRYLEEHPGEVVLLRLASRGPWMELHRSPLPPPEARGDLP